MNSITTETITGEELVSGIVMLFGITKTAARGHVHHWTRTGRLTNVGGSGRGRARYDPVEVRALLAEARDLRSKP